MKVIIADDERLVRVSLKIMLEESSFPLEIVGEAGNGSEMIEKIIECQPDIAFVDIKMPGLNGLEAIKRCKPLSPNTQWIILTGYSEFNYAKQALQLAATDYLLKPVSPAELDLTLQKALNTYHEFLSKRNKEFENELVSFLHGVSTETEISSTLSTKATYQATILFIDSHLPECEKNKHLTDFYNHIHSITSECLSNESRVALFALNHNEIAIVTAWGLLKRNDGNKLMEEFLHRVEDILLIHCNECFSITMITGPISKLEDTPKIIKDIQEEAFLRAISGINRKWTISQLNQVKKQKDLNEISSLLLKFSDYYCNRNSLNYIKILNDLEKKLLVMNEKHIKNHIREYLCSTIPCTLNGDGPVQEWISILRSLNDHLLKENYQEDDRSTNLINQVLQFVDENYMNDIGIGQIAQELNVTPNYLSTLFHKKIGTTFKKYLTSSRILKAKELLSDPTNQVQKVAEAVGYYSTRHFTKLFTEIVGCYPSEYQKNVRKKRLEKQLYK